jgi:3-oxoacyl-[acyl-carrier-protein] synthase III
MFTEALKMTDVAVKHGARHALHILEKAGWSPDSFQHLIMHQTSSTTLGSLTHEINRLLKRPICHEGNTIDNLAQRGNTASTTHFVAVMDNIHNNKIHSGDKVIFGIGGSGQTMGTALYTFDDLPDRLRRTAANQQSHQKIAAGGPNPLTAPLPDTPRIRIESLGTVPADGTAQNDSMKFLKIAAEDCLERSSYQRNDIDLLIHAGVYRNEFISEPAIAALLAGELDINAATASPEGKRTLAFDVFNGALGLLNACHIAVQMIRAKKCKNAMIVTAEIENNTGAFPEELLGLQDTGSALILDEALAGKAGFGHILFRAFTDHPDAFTSHLTNKNSKAYLHFDRSPDLEAHYIAGILYTVRELLLMEDLELTQITKIFPPQISSAFIAKLSEAMNLSNDRFVDAVGESQDLFTSSLPCALQFAHEHNLVKVGDIGLIISVGSGIQVGCAVYYF